MQATEALLCASDKGVAHVLDARSGASLHALKDCRPCAGGLCAAGGCTLRDNDVFGNAAAGVRVCDGAAPLLERNTLRDGGDCGVVVCAGCAPLLRDNEVTRNAKAGVIAHGDGAAPTLIANRLLRGLQAGAYFYDGAAVDTVRTRRPHFGSQFTRTPEENYALRTDDILTEKVFNREYPKALIQTRATNRTDDITGAQADTKGAGPQIWRKPGKDPATCYEKETNRTWDIDGAVAGTGGQSIRLYRAARQEEAIERGKAARVAQEEKRAANAA